MIRIYTKQRHISKITKFLNSLNIEHQIYTIKDNPSITPFDLGVSYCYPKKITHGEYNYSTNEFHTIEMTLRYDHFINTNDKKGTVDHIVG